MKPLFAPVTALAIAACACGADWPTYRGDSARTGYSAGALSRDLSLWWVYRAPHKPQPAWPGRDTRMPFDRLEDL